VDPRKKKRVVNPMTKAVRKGRAERWTLENANEGNSYQAKKNNQFPQGSEASINGGNTCRDWKVGAVGRKSNLHGTRGATRPEDPTRNE